VGQQQAKLYADCLAAQFGQRPVIFYTNGYDHWLWDDTGYPPRQVQGFYKQAELELLIQRRSSQRPLGSAGINEAIVERYYQTRAIRRIGEAFDQDRDRKAQVVMATGAGKTRTVIALCDLLMRCNWVKRVLFLADRVALVRQAVNAFKHHLPDAAPVNLFAKNRAYAEFIAERFNAHYPHYLGAFARVITFKTEYAQSLIDAFSIKDKPPHIAISVDMLDTGIDVPEVVNLVFFKLVRSKTKFWQMLGRGTRLCPDLFAPGQDKGFFYLFDYCQNLDNFVVRPKRQWVERYAEAAAWTTLSDEAHGELAHEVAGLPSELVPEAEECKRFDLLILNLQLALLCSAPAFERLRDQVRAIAGLLEEKSAIPMVREQMALIQKVQTEEWWEDVTIPMLETVRRRLRALVQFIEKRRRKPIYTDFEDEMGRETSIELPGFGVSGDFEQFRAKARAFLRDHQDHVTIRKLRANETLTAADLAELERMLAQSGIGGAGAIARAKTESHGLGLFVRSLVGLDRGAAKEALAGFLSGKTLSASQIEFVNLIVDHLTEHGVMDATLLYESPFTDLTPRGPDGLFTSAQVDELMAVLRRVRDTASATREY
jgi:type I site-specific restriction endonuclease